MKLENLGLSVLAVVAFTTNVYSADSLKDAFSNGKFDGGFKAVIYDVDKAAKGKESITSLGVMLHYTTAPFYGFSIRFKSSVK